MVCCVFCAGEGFFSKCVSIVVSLTFSFHVFGFLSPYWFCDGDDCKLMGLYFHCDDGTCDGEVMDDPILTLVVIILISSLTLALTLCFVLNCTKCEWRKMSPKMSLFIGGWFLIQELLTTSVLIAIAVKYDRIGWSAYVFTVPGIIFLGFMMVVLIYMWCFPTKTVNPTDFP